ncbi:MAG: glycosyltransferase, partial [Verrucomicrobiota bacterium]
PIAVVVEDGRNGLLFRPGSPEALRAALLRLVEDPALRERLGRQARADVLERHTWKANALRVLDGLRQVTGNG